MSYLVTPSRALGVFFTERNGLGKAQRTLRGTHQGDFMGFPACGRLIVWRDMVTSQFRDGLIAEDW